MTQRDASATEIRFYHLERQSLQQILPGLLGKVLESGRRAVLRACSPAQAEDLAEHLWTYDPASFLPHGTQKDGFAADQPVWITAQADENPAGARVLVLVPGADAQGAGGYDLCCALIDGHDPQSVAQAREDWRGFKAQGFSVTYWQQTAQGWEKKEG